MVITKMAEDTFDLLATIVRQTRCKPGWSFRLADEDGAKRLVITIRGHNNYKDDEPYTVAHFHPCPVCTYNEKSWRRWIFEQCIRTMNHEIGESLRFGGDGNDGLRPFAPMHGPGEDPYTVHEWRSETDALTTQDGTLRKAPV
jgi:hypothetical protein